MIFEFLALTLLLYFLTVCFLSFKLKRNNYTYAFTYGLQCNN